MPVVNVGHLYLLVLHLIGYVCSQPQQFVELDLTPGRVRGLRIRSAQNRDAIAFLGIPYAAPPYDDLRFKPPVAHPGWEGLLDATNYRSMCPQYDSRSNQIGSEDCLFLNVYAPALRKQPKPTERKSLFPVMVYIQAESFETGDSAVYGAELLLDRDVVVVTFNYRLGILGFLSTEDEIASGNWGLYDQKLVLEWVRNNIASFNGDPNSVTIFGQGSGLIHRAIAQSGSALCDWALERSPLAFAREVAQSVGCPALTNIDLVQCLRTTPFTQLLKAQSRGKIFGEFPQRSAPVVERTGSNRFLPDDPHKLLLEGNFHKIPLMMGLNTNETSYFYPLLVHNKRLRTDPMGLEKKLLVNFLEATTGFKGSKSKELIQTILFKYFNRVDLMNVSDISSRFIEMSSDALYHSCIDRTLKLYSQHSDASVFMYLFAYKGRHSLVDLLVDSGSHKLFDTGVCHGDELFYLFDLKGSSLGRPDRKEKQIRQRLLTLWTDFAKFGFAPQFPNYEYPRWKRFDGQTLEYLRIDSDLRPERAFRQSEAQFWSKHLPNLYGGLPVGQPLTTTDRPYAALAWAMVAVSIGLLLLIIILLGVLYCQRKRRSFNAQAAEGSAISSTGSSFLY